MKASLSAVLAIGMAIALVGSSSSAWAHEKKIAPKDLPATVSSAFKAAYPSAKIKGAGTETEDGVEYYEIESVDGKTRRDLLYTKDGKVCEIEEMVKSGGPSRGGEAGLGQGLPAGEDPKSGENHPRNKDRVRTQGAERSEEIRGVLR